MASPQPIANLLAKTGLFESLDAADRQAIASHMVETNFAPNQVIFQRGDTGSDLYLVLEGRVRLSILTAEGREFSFAHASRGAIFGEIAVLDGAARSADATAISPVTVMKLAKSVMNSLIDTRPSIARAVIAFLCARLREADHQLEAIALHPIQVRLARLFLSLLKPIGSEHHPTNVVLSLDMSQSEIGLLIGASRPKVNGALAILEESGAIIRVNGKFNCNVEELEAIAESG